MHCKHAPSSTQPISNSLHSFVALAIKFCSPFCDAAHIDNLHCIQRKVNPKHSDTNALILSNVYIFHHTQSCFNFPLLLVSDHLCAVIHKSLPNLISSLVLSLPPRHVPRHFTKQNASAFSPEHQHPGIPSIHILLRVTVNLQLLNSNVRYVDLTCKGHGQGLNFLARPQLLDLDPTSWPGPNFLSRPNVRNLSHPSLNSEDQITLRSFNTNCY